jgi:hypothetical protein
LKAEDTESSEVDRFACMDWYSCLKLGSAVVA